MEPSVSPGTRLTIRLLLQVYGSTTFITNILAQPMGPGGARAGTLPLIRPDSAWWAHSQ